MTSLLSWFRDLYSLNTLDSRFTTTATSPPRSASDSDSTRPGSSSKDARANAIASNAQPSKWRTPEFYVYYGVFLTLVPLMFKTVVDVSRGELNLQQRKGIKGLD